MAFSTERCIPNGIRGFGKLNRCILFVFLIFSVSAFGQTDLKMLEKAYKNQSVEELKSFFDAWSNEIQPITETELLTYNDTIQQAYKAFTAFYKPHRLDSIGEPEWGNDIYENVKYLIVQNEIKVYFHSTVEEYTIQQISQSSLSDSKKMKLLKQGKDGKFSRKTIATFNPWHENIILTNSITNFRPQINCGDKISVYLTPKYDTLLNVFLGNTHKKFGDPDIMSAASAEGESQERKDFLENDIKIYYGHWGGYWQLHSYPQIDMLIFDKNMENAVIYFRMIYQGGEAILKKEGDMWIFISSKLTWIE